MSIISNYIAYLKDNKEGYWFKRKLYGWGWTPAKPQGWLSVVFYLVAVIYFAVRLDPLAGEDTVVREFIVPLLIATLLLLLVSYLKGEKPKWQWGKHIPD